MATGRQDAIEMDREFSERTMGSASHLGLTGIRQLKRRVQSTVANLDINETTIPDAFQGVPKVISPRVHRWLDIAVTGYFLALGAWFLGRRKRKAATSALINAGMVAGVSALTDYEGTGKKPISFKMHGTLDAMQAATAAMGPVLHGFSGKRESALFYGQAINELAVIAATDWDAGMRNNRERDGAA
jgi:hypothetical protein